MIERSVVIQGILTLLVVSTWLFLFITGVTPPDALTNIVSLVVGFYFGSKVTDNVRTNRRKRIDAKKPASDFLNK